MIPCRMTIHCSDSPNDRDWINAEEITRWHKARGFRQIGYHFVIKRDGTVESGRPLDKQGAHVEGENEGNVGICLVGRDLFTREQFKALRELLNSLTKLVPPIPKSQLFTHNYYNSNKSCPNIPLGNLRGWFTEGDEDLIAPYVYSKESK